MASEIRVRVTLRGGHHAQARANAANEMAGATWVEAPTRPACAGGQHTNGPEHWIGVLAIAPEKLDAWLAHAQPYEVCDATA